MKIPNIYIAKIMEYSDIKNQRIREQWSKPYLMHYGDRNAYRPARYGKEKIRIKAFPFSFNETQRERDVVQYWNKDKFPRFIDLSGWYITIGRIYLGDPVYWLSPGTYGFNFNSGGNFPIAFNIREFPEPRWVGNIAKDRRSGSGWTLRIDTDAAIIDRLD